MPKIVIPKGWRACPSDLALIGDTFVTFKTPISNQYDSRPELVFEFASSLQVNYFKDSQRMCDTECCGLFVIWAASLYAYRY